jgi:hypothetical protein
VKGILQFDLPEEQEEHQTAIDARAWKTVVSELDEYLRRLVKYSDKKSIKIEDVRAQLHELCRDRNLL